MSAHRTALLLACFMLGASHAALAGDDAGALRLAHWGDVGVQFAPDRHRGAWGRRWTGQMGTVRMMLTLYRSPQDAARVAGLARGLGESAADEDDAAFLANFLPGEWPVRKLGSQIAAIGEGARGLCLDVGLWHQKETHRLCSASRPDSAAVATVLAPKREDVASMAALLLARYAARNPVRVASPE